MSRAGWARKAPPMVYSCEHGRQKTPCVECDRERDQLRADLDVERRAHEQCDEVQRRNANEALDARSALKAANERVAAFKHWTQQLIENDGAGYNYHAGRATEARDELRALIYYDICAQCKRVMHAGESHECAALAQPQTEEPSK